MKQQLERPQYEYFINISGEWDHCAESRDKEVFPSLSLVSVQVGLMQAEKILVEIVLQQNGNYFLFLGLSCCEVVSTINVIPENKVTLNWKFLDIYALILQPNSLHVNLGLEFCFL